MTELLKALYVIANPILWGEAISERSRSLLSRKKTGQAARAHRDDVDILSFTHYAQKIEVKSCIDVKVLLFGHPLFYVDQDIESEWFQNHPVSVFPPKLNICYPLVW